MNHANDERADHRITPRWGLEGTSGDHPVPTPAQSGLSSNRLPRAMYIQVLNTPNNGDSTISLGNLFYCLTTLTVFKEIKSLLFVPITSCPVTDYHWEESVSFTPSCQVFTHTDKMPWTSSCPGRTVPAHSAPPPQRGAPNPYTFWWPFAGLAPVHPCLFWGSQIWTQPSRCCLTRLGKEERPSPSTSWQCSAEGSPAGRGPPLPQEHIAGSWSPWCPPAAPEPLLPSCFPAIQPHSLYWCMGWGTRQGPASPQTLEHDWTVPAGCLHVNYQVICNSLYMYR